MALSAAQVEDIIIIERIASCLSLVGTSFVLLTFALNDKFRKPINRLVVCATFGNVITNIATLISTSGIEAGVGSPLCQFQGFLIQWFMPADALWTFAMACNVWLSFFRSYDASSLRRLEWKYTVLCYGLPFIPAFTYLFISTQGRGKVYGTAVLWCWVSLRWDFLRVATFYGPVWVVILMTFGVYIRVGTVVFRWRNKLISANRSRSYGDDYEYPASGIMKTSEVIVTRTVEVQSPTDVRSSGHPSFPTTPESRPKAGQAKVHRNTGFDPNKASLKYCKCAMLFFVALIITWVPSTVNRIYTIVWPTETVFGLNLAAALVLPLQGFWNAIIYTATSSFAVKCLWEDIMDVTFRRASRNSSLPLRSRGTSIPSQPYNPRLSKHRSLTTTYDEDKSSSQSELVGLAK